MSIVLLTPGLSDKAKVAPVEIVKLDGKYYIELKQFENAEDIIELSLSLSSEVESLKQKIQTLEEKLILERGRK
jgi:hypothetical protein